MTAVSVTAHEEDSAIWRISGTAPIRRSQTGTPIVTRHTRGRPTAWDYPYTFAIILLGTAATVGPWLVYLVRLTDPVAN